MNPRSELEQFLEREAQQLAADLEKTLALRDMVRDKQQAANQTPAVRRQHLRLLQGGAS